MRYESWAGRVGGRRGKKRGRRGGRERVDRLLFRKSKLIHPSTSPTRIFPSSLPRVSLVLDAVGPRLLVVESRIAGEIERVLLLVEK